MTDIKLFEFGPTRSARCRWTLLEAGLDFESFDKGADTVRAPELAEVHPIPKVPAAVFAGRPLFESAAISTFIADSVPEKKLIAPSGTWERALHDQWTSFVLTEMEAWLWSSALNSFILPEERRIDAVHEQNAALFKRGARGMDAALADADYLVDNRFTVTDIIAGYTVNWARRRDLIDDFPNLQAYNSRLLEREHCPLDKE